VASAQQINIAQALGVSSFAITPYGSGCPIGSISPCETFTASSPITFQFDIANPYDPNFQYTVLNAQLTWSAVSTTPATDETDGEYKERNFQGTFGITSGGLNLLSGTFTKGTLDVNGYTAGFTTGQSSIVSFNSDYLTWGSNTTFALSVSTTLSHLDSLDANSFLTYDLSWGTATFSSSPPPEFHTPEPTTILLSGGAFLGIGYLLSRRKKRRPVS
jgi:hypothetical protein